MCLATVLVAELAIVNRAAASSPASSDPTVITDWNTIAVNTLIADTTKAPVETILYMGFVQAAVYDAVVGIRGRYEPYRFDERAPRHASAQAAAVAAAHKVLVTYSPAAQASLDAAYAASLAQIPDGTPKADGVTYGIEAADNIIALRANDGRNAPVVFTRLPAPGVWRPTPPAFLPMATPWLGGVTPLVVRSATQFGPSRPPPDLTSRQYTRDFVEVKALGSMASAARTPEQTRTALFFSGNAAVQFNAALRDQVSVRHLDIVDAAHMFAAVDMSASDFVITVWNAKLLYGSWRPITAINLADTDANPATMADPSWVPLINTPNYPGYPSGYSAYAATVTRALERIFDTRHLDLTLISTAVPEVRHYDTGAAVRQDVVDARVWLGIHFRVDDTTGRRMGERLADWTTRHYFQPVDDD
jgi:hypothetical protein